MRNCEYDFKKHALSIICVCLTIFSVSCIQSSKSENLIAATSIKYIKENKLDLLLGSCSELSQQKKDSGEFIMLLNNLHELLTEYRIPNWSNHLPSGHINSDSEAIYTIHNYEYRLTTKIYELPDSIVILKIGVIEDKLYSIEYKKLPSKFTVLEPVKTDHQNHFDLRLDDLNEFRFYYEPGSVKRSTLNNIQFYSVSGNIDKLKKCKLYISFEQLFNLLNVAVFDSTDYKYMISFTRGDSEYFYLRFKFNEEPYSKFGDFQIIICLSNEPNVDEELMSHIILIHSKTTRYFMQKASNAELALLLEEMAHAKYEKCKE